METAQTQDVEKLKKLIKDIKIGMLTTTEQGGWLHSRPMATIECEFNGELWFFTRASAPKVDEVEREHHVNISYASEKDHRFASVSGMAQLVRDKAKCAQLWNPLFKAWFPKGLDDPELALLKVTLEKAEYWDTPPGAVVKVVGFAKALLTGKPYEPGENKKVDLARH